MFSKRDTTYAFGFLSINQVLLAILLLLGALAVNGIILGVLAGGGLARVPLIERLLWDTVEELLGVDSEKFPGLIEGVEDGSLFVSTCKVIVSTDARI